MGESDRLSLSCRPFIWKLQYFSNFRIYSDTLLTPTELVVFVCLDEILIVIYLQRKVQLYLAFL